MISTEAIVSVKIGGFLGPLVDSYFLEDADVIYRESPELDHLGNTLSCGRDINQDGYEDCAFAAYWDSSRAARGGAARAHLLVTHPPNRGFSRFHG